MSYCLLDTLPVELIHHLLNYFFANEILYTFANVSSYIDDILLIYSTYYVNFKSATRKQFESICQRIKPDQVVSLTLCNDEHTPGQVELFLSRFQLNQFTRLRSLTLVDVGPDYWEPIITKLIDLKNLRSFIYNPPDSSNPFISKISGGDVTKLDKRLFDSYSPILPQLNRLKLTHANFLSCVQFPYLRHLIIRDCKANIMQHICSAAPQLKSLETNLECDMSNKEFIFSFDQLNRLVLRFTGLTISMNNMEELMAKLPSLKYLELCGRGHADIVDGQRWETIASSLNTFNFKFNLSTDVDVQNLDSFRTPFWLIEKHWYVAYSNGYIFSVPYFANMETDEELQPPALCTAPDISIFNRCIKKLNLSKPVAHISHRFSEVETLSMSDSNRLLFIEQIVDLNRIQHLNLHSITRFFELIVLMNKMPNLYQISIVDNVKHFVEEISGASFLQIQNLHIGRYYPTNDTHDDNDYDIEELCSIFPCVKYLRIAHLCSETQIFEFMNHFKQLTTASFCYISPNRYSVDEKRVAEIQSALDDYRSIGKLDYSYRFEKSSLYIWL